jgi:hypothetical protein
MRTQSNELELLNIDIMILCVIFWLSQCAYGVCGYKDTSFVKVIPFQNYLVTSKLEFVWSSMTGWNNIA